MPKATKVQSSQLAHLSSDCSFLLSHLIRQNSEANRSDNQALFLLKSILGLAEDSVAIKPTLKASTTGWFGACKSAKIYSPDNPHYFSRPTRTQGVCFTESTLSGLKAHRDIFSAKYGLAFDRDYLFSQGANPCLNIREETLKFKINKNANRYGKLYNFIPDALAGYVNIINDVFDATHEREWRYLGDLEFIISHIKFIFCPERDFHVFAPLQEKGIPCLFDLAWLDRV
jgi:hypothetical protein